MKQTPTGTERISSFHNTPRPMHIRIDRDTLIIDAAHAVNR